MSRIQIIGVVSALVFWLLSAQGSALEHRCDGDCSKIDFDSGVGFMADSENGWPSARWDPMCNKSGDSDFAAGSCATRFDMTHVDRQTGRVPTLSRWWMIIAMISLAFVGFFYLHWESLNSVDNVLPEDVDEQTQDMAKIFADIARDRPPGR